MTEPLLVLHALHDTYLDMFRAAGLEPYRGWNKADHVAADAEIASELRILLTSGSRGLTAEEMDTYPKLEMVLALGAGYENIDHKAARARGLVVTHGPGANARQVADHAMALILGTMHKIAQGDAAVRAGRWSQFRRDLHPSISGRKLGVLGLGRIGREIAKSGSGGFAMPIGYTARNPRSDVDYSYFEDPIALARWADVIAIATPGGDGTRHLVNAAFLEALGSDGYLVNIARGSVVDTDALIEALKTGVIAGAGLDVIEGEPEVPAALLACDTVVFTPHIGGHAPEAVKATVELAIENIQAHLAGKPVLTPVPEK
ncbi:2-hydroxyacid dehydrogenase [Amorphus sp. 3PC139-8]|uniref:2-hydroxyacid dehydrogenase n=1 Tax=Amorphus sp. 3PC139-8 TaxID=2735676 RepID=UPI00345C7AFA